MTPRQMLLCAMTAAALAACQGGSTNLSGPPPAPPKPAASPSPLPSPTPSSSPSPGALKVTNEFPIPAAGPARPFLYGITAGPDGALWFTDGYNPYVGRLTTSGSVTTYPLTNAGSALVIHAESDGNLWFTAAQQNFGGTFYVESITTAGAITLRGQLAGSSIGGNFYDFTQGPDGALWYGYHPVTGEVVGRFTLAGNNTTYPFAPGGFLYGVASGPDGALWFTDEQNTKALVRVTTAGTITSVPIPSSPNISMGAIAVGSDGAFWIAEGDRIGRYTTAGAYQEYVVPSTSRPDVVNLCLGADGAMYFTDFNANRIGRITTAGVVTSYPLPNPQDSTNFCTLGPDGAIWFTEPNNKIGRLG